MEQPSLARTLALHRRSRRLVLLTPVVLAMGQRKIAERIKADVLSGALKADDQVMSTNQYAAFHRINPATAAKAFAELVDEGVLVKQRGIGMFVAAGAPDRLRARRREAFFAERLDPVLHEAGLLGISTEELLTHLRTHTHQTPKGAGR